MTEQEFAKEIKKLDIDLSSKQITQLQDYCDFLLQENQKFNLTAIKTKESVYLKHFYDSLAIIQVIDLNKVSNLADLGSGAGFPGIVLKIAFPHLKTTLIESNAKKCRFLLQIIEKLALKDINVVNQRVEDCQLVEQFQLVTARAVAALPILLELGAPLTEINGKLIFYKGDISREINTTAAKKLELVKKSQKTYQMPFSQEQRTLIIYQKVKKTPKKYPRNYNLIKKQPL